MKELIEVAIEASIIAGDEILKIYDSDFNVEHKEDNSPLTKADQLAHQAIVRKLDHTSIPILSEEGKHLPYDDRKKWDKFWLVDPLDGTKEFIKRNGEFTVNIALMEGNYPIAGVIYVPVKRWIYFGWEDGSFKLEMNGKERYTSGEIMSNAIELPLNADNRGHTIVGSKSHPSPETNEYIEKAKNKYGDVNIISMGSSLKLCLVAEGEADEYPRFAPTMEWDTAAGQAIVESGGGKVINWETQERMSYNKENLLNSWFLASR